ncbi:MAG: hypothetical protein J1F31_02815 [Erysipelotrichales bacterium]|nr:hypothetical protein [Erysipelotrichales bacterium]
MNKLENLTSKWWFRLAILLGFALVMFILAMSLIPNDRESANYANEGTLTVMSCILVNSATVVMYFATDVLDNLHLKIGKIIRKLLLLISLGVVALTLLIAGISYLINVTKGYTLQPFYDGIGFAPFITYVFLYFFVVGKFEVVNEKGPNRLKQFILILVACIAPIIVGILFVLILKLINSETVSFIALIAFYAILVLSFVFSIRKYGLLLGGTKEYERDKPVYTSTSNSTYGEWENTFKSKIEGHSYGMYTTVTCYAYKFNGIIEVRVKIDYYGSNDDSIIARRISEIASEVRNVYSSVAKKCPDSSKLKIE